ncbi:MAG: transcriptional regulator [Ginsengibacter sp.]
MINLRRRDVFQAIAIRHAGKFDVSRPVISNDIKILTECGQIVINLRGRERCCEAKQELPGEVSEFTEQYRVVWTAKFDVLEY